MVARGARCRRMRTCAAPPTGTGSDPEGPLSARCGSGRRDRHPRCGFMTSTRQSARTSLTSSTSTRKRRGAPPPRLHIFACRARAVRRVAVSWAAVERRGPCSNLSCHHGLCRGAGNNPGLGSANRGFPLAQNDTPNTPFVSSSCVCMRAHAMCVRARVCAAFGKRGGDTRRIFPWSSNCTMAGASNLRKICGVPGIPPPGSDSPGSGGPRFAQQ